MPTSSNDEKQKRVARQRWILLSGKAIVELGRPRARFARVKRERPRNGNAERTGNVRVQRRGWRAIETAKA